MVINRREKVKGDIVVNNCKLLTDYSGSAVLKIIEKNLGAVSS